MLKKRMILCLLANNKGIFFNSRNFSLQPVGEAAWIKQYLDFNSIDELIMLNVDRREKNIEAFATHLMGLAKTCFVPVAGGGGIANMAHIERLLDAGCDKVVVNSEFLRRPAFITEAAKIFGSQCIVASIDVRQSDDGAYICYAGNGITNTNREILSWAREVEDRGAGEIFLTSIDRDGAGTGYDLGLIRRVAETVSIPVIASGGVGELSHLLDGIKKGGASAVSAANIFHYIGHGLIKARKFLRDQGVDFPLWHFV
jgi:imidazole glycerol-phosphate synthase subunit HisF